MPPEFSGPRSRPSRYALFARRLKDAHAALRDPRISAVHRMELTKRVLAITALARHDVNVAAARLEAFFSELSGLVPPVPVSGAQGRRERSAIPPSAENTATQG